VTEELMMHFLPSLQFYWLWWLCSPHYYHIIPYLLLSLRKMLSSWKLVLSARRETGSHTESLM